MGLKAVAVRVDLLELLVPPQDILHNDTGCLLLPEVSLHVYEVVSHFDRIVLRKGPFRKLAGQLRS